MVKGLADAGVLAMIQKLPDLFRPLFVYSHAALTAGEVMKVTLMLYLTILILLLYYCFISLF